MAVCALSKAFRRLNLLRKENVTVRYLITQAGTPGISTPNILQLEKPRIEVIERHDIVYSFNSISLNFNIPRNQLPLNKIIENPLIPNFQIDEPVKNNIEKNDITPIKIIDTPPTTNIIEKRAERMIVIRRKKMKKHRRKKFLKKMKFVIRKREQKKKMLREKRFEAELQSIYQEAEKFDPKKYVAERIHLLTRERLPNKWRGVHLPESMIRQFMKEKEERKAHKLRLHTYRLKLD